MPSAELRRAIRPSPSASFPTSTATTFASRRRCLTLGVASGLVLAAGIGLPGCATSWAEPGDARGAWEARLRADTVALLGEVHDNRAGLERRAQALRRAVEAGWRPAVLMEQFDTDRQDALDAARARAPRDVEALIAAAGADGWDWPGYRSALALVLDAGLPLVAANLSRDETRRLVREPYAAVFGEARTGALGLVPEPADAWQAAQRDEIRQGHCNALPERLLPGMARAQFARDAVMAEALRRHAARGVVLLAGNGHVRRDLGVPRWLGALPARQLLAVGYVEPGDPLPAEAFDVRVVSEAPVREHDPCAGLG